MSLVVDMCPELVDMCPELVEGLLIGPSTGSGRMSLRPELVLSVFEEPLGEPSSGGSRIRVWLLVQKLIKEIFVQARCIERIAAAPMRQSQPRGGADVGLGDIPPALPRGMRSSRPSGDNVSPHAVNLERPTHPGDGRQLADHLAVPTAAATGLWRS